MLLSYFRKGLASERSQTFSYLRPQQRAPHGWLRGRPGAGGQGRLMVLLWAAPSLLCARRVSCLTCRHDELRAEGDLAAPHSAASRAGPGPAAPGRWVGARSVPPAPGALPLPLRAQAAVRGAGLQRWSPCLPPRCERAGGRDGAGERLCLESRVSFLTEMLAGARDKDVSHSLALMFMFAALGALRAAWKPRSWMLKSWNASRAAGSHRAPGTRYARLCMLGSL